MKKDLLLFLDDVRTPYCVFKSKLLPIYENNENWVIVRDYFQFIEFIKKMEFVMS